jgi:hypothetical protein
MSTFSFVVTHSRRLARTSATIGAAGVLLFLAACGGDDVGAAKLKSIPKGANRAAILDVVGTGPMTATAEGDKLRLVNGYRRSMYLSAASPIEVIWYRESPGSMDENIVVERETPVVLTSDTLAGWGWSFYHDFAQKMKIPDPTRDSLRLDSLSKSQTKTVAK